MSTLWRLLSVVCILLFCLRPNVPALTSDRQFSVYENLRGSSQPAVVEQEQLHAVHAALLKMIKSHETEDLVLKVNPMLLILNVCLILSIQHHLEWEKQEYIWNRVKHEGVKCLVFVALSSQKLIPELQKLFMSKNETNVLKLWPLFVKLLGKVTSAVSVWTFPLSKFFGFVLFHQSVRNLAVDLWSCLSWTLS